MPVEHDDNGQPVWRRRSRRQALVHWLTTLGLAGVVLWCFKLIADETTWSFVWTAPEQGTDLAIRMFLPEWFVHIPELWRNGELWAHLGAFLGDRLAYAVELWDPLIDTLHIATLGTVLGVMIATPLAFMAANNTSLINIVVQPILGGLHRIAPSPLRPAINRLTQLTPKIARKVERPFALLLLVTSRSVNSLIWALLLVVIIGPGMLSGILAIALRSVGFCGKLLYEAIEEIDEETRDAVKSTGASPLQEMTYGVIPQIAPAFAGISIYRWDINIREATILGLVGAGGIGMALQAAIDELAWGEVSVIFAAILATVVLSEWVSAKARAAVT